MGEGIPVSVEELERLPKFSKPPPETWNRLGKSVQKNVVICRRQVNLQTSRHRRALGDYPVNQQLRAKFAKRDAQKAVLGLLLLRCLEGSEQRADALALRAVRLLYQK